MSLLERFLRYVRFDTTSDPASYSRPSSPGQVALGAALVEELRLIGLRHAGIDENGYVMATLPSNVKGESPVIGFIAHLDTSPDFTGKNVKPRVIHSYDGSDICLDPGSQLFLKPSHFPELNNYLGHDIITTGGNTLLGADNKAGIAIIVTAMEYLVNNPGIKHGEIKIAFTPDEEIGRGADRFDIKKFGASFAYTVDGGEIGELEYENFNAASAKVTFKGVNVHPGYAKDKMKSAILAAARFIGLIPPNEMPHQSSGRQGFFHILSLNGDVDKSEINLIIRDFCIDGLKKRKEFVLELAQTIGEGFSPGSVKVEINDQYFNMKREIEPVMHVVELAREAMINAGVKPLERPVRGGTDGARLSYMGLPTPNLFTGGHNFHGPYEFVSLQGMEKAVQVVVNICQLAPKHYPPGTRNP